jgi:hypothetical protein
MTTGGRVPTVEEARALVGAALTALQRGEAARGQALLEQAVASGRLDPPPWLLLAQACRMTGDASGEFAALDRVLAIDPGNLRAVIMKGDWFARARDTRAATSFYMLVGKIAQGETALPPDLQAGVANAAAWVRDAGRDYFAHLQTRLHDAGHDLAALPARFAESLDILAGRAPIQPQAPTSFYYPQTLQAQFFDRRDFPWLDDVEAAVPAMQAELAALLAQAGSSFTPYMTADPTRPAGTHPLLDDPDWSALHLWKSGALVPENAAHFPQTLAALQSAPLPHIRARSPMVLFSQLRPHTHIPPHHGLLNSRLIVHVPLVCPADCRLRVGNQTRTWETGKAWVFDDSIEHEAWNDSDQTRIILLFEIWRPELSTDERAALTTLYEAITDFGGDVAGI